MVISVTNAAATLLAAALAVSLAIVLTSMAPEAKAEVFDAPLLAPDGVAKAPLCLLQGWPHYEQGCQFDLRASATEMRTVRVIALR